MAGSISIAGSQQFDELGKLLAGGRVYWIQAGTTSTPQNAFYDPALTLPLPNYYTLQADARVPFHYLADGQIKVRIQDANGVIRFEQDNILVIGPSSGGGGGGGVDPTTVFQTGDVMWLDVQGTRTGWVRDNGRTLGNASSGATERANADTSALFAWLWNNFTNTQCPVSGGRGANAAADFAANKTITLPDKRGYIVGGLDDMGNSAAGRFANVPVVSGDVTTAGSVIGATTTTLITANLPPYTPSGSVASSGTVALRYNASWGFTVGGTAVPLISKTAHGLAPNSEDWTLSISSSFTGTAQGGTSTAFGNVQKTVLGTVFRKL